VSRIKLISCPRGTAEKTAYLEMRKKIKIHSISRPHRSLRLPVLGELCLLSSAVCEAVKIEGQGYQDSEHTSKQSQI